MINAKETILTDVYGGEHGSLSSLGYGGIVDFVVPAETPNWLDYRVAGDTTEGAALTTNTFGQGIMYGAYVHGARSSAYGKDGSLSVLRFTCQDTHGEHRLQRWTAGNGMSGATPLETINLANTYDPLTNGQEFLAWFATDSFLVSSLQWDSATQRKMHVIERFTEGVYQWNTISAQRETFDPMLPPNKITSTFLSLAGSKEYEIVLRGRCAKRVYGVYDWAQSVYFPLSGPESTPTEFMLQVSTESTFATAGLISTYVVPADEDFVETGYARSWNGTYGDEGRFHILRSDSGLSDMSGGKDNLLGMNVYITEGTGVGSSGYVYHTDWEETSSPDDTIVLWVWRDHFSAPLDATSKWELRYKQGTQHIIVPIDATYYYRFAQRHDSDPWSGWSLFESLYDVAWGEERDASRWIHWQHVLSDLPIWDWVCYAANTYIGPLSAWRVKVNDADFAATKWRIQGSVSADFTDDPIPLNETGFFANYVSSCNVVRADTILDLAVPAAGWYVRARGENDDGSIVSEWSEDIYAKAGQADQSHSYTTYVPTYVGHRSTNQCIDLVATTSSGYVLLHCSTYSVASQVETDDGEELRLYPIGFSGTLGGVIVVASNAGNINYQAVASAMGGKVYVSYYVWDGSVGTLHWRVYDEAAATLGAEHEAGLPTGYTDLGSGHIWQSGGLLFTQVWAYGATTTVHLAYADTAVSDTLQVLENTHPDDGDMQGWSGWGFWYPFVTDYDAYEDYGVAFLSTGQLKSFPWVGRFQLSKA
jgi:hypothetical protein